MQGLTGITATSHMQEKVSRILLKISDLIYIDLGVQMHIRKEKKKGIR